jgi:hypothetical protein
MKFMEPNSIWYVNGDLSDTLGDFEVLTLKPKEKRDLIECLKFCNIYNVSCVKEREIDRKWFMKTIKHLEME